MATFSDAQLAGRAALSRLVERLPPVRSPGILSVLQLLSRRDWALALLLSEEAEVSAPPALRRAARSERARLYNRVRAGLGYELAELVDDPLYCASCSLLVDDQPWLSTTLLEPLEAMVALAGALDGEPELIEVVGRLLVEWAGSIPALLESARALLLA